MVFVIEAAIPAPQSARARYSTLVLRSYFRSPLQ